MSTAEVVAKLRQSGLFLAVAESLTGGALAAEIVSIPGASNVFIGAIVAYQTELKHSELGVPNDLLARSGAVDPEVAALMAAGVRTKLSEGTGLPMDRIVGISTTGVAGPDSQDGKPVGQVFIALDSRDCKIVLPLQLVGDRASIRQQTVELAIDALAEHI